MNTVDITKKTCTICGQPQSLSEFHKMGGKRKGYRSACKICLRAKDRARHETRKTYFKEYRRTNEYKEREQQRQLSEEWKAERKITQQKNRLKINYGITIETYDGMLSSQNGVCAICNRTPGRRRLAVDHSHATGKIRGLLCGSCNQALGYFYEDVSRLQQAITYLRSWSEPGK